MQTRILFTFLIFLISTNSFSFGIGDWIYHTPNGSTLDDPGGGISLNTLNHLRLQNLRKWYFYKNNIIGISDPASNGQSTPSFFLVDEISGKIETFNNSKIWNKRIEDAELKPKIFTYWHTSHIRLFYILWIWYNFFKWQFILIVCGIIFIVFKSIIGEKINPRKPYTITSLLILMIFLISILLDNWIVSI